MSIGDISTKTLIGEKEQIFLTGRAFAAINKDGSVVTWGGSGSGGDSSVLVVS